jgi:hypothetical protein
VTSLAQSQPETSSCGYREADSAASRIDAATTSGFDTLSACEHPGELGSLTKHRVRREHEAGQFRWDVGSGGVLAL